MYCMHCGEQIADNSRYCKYCGRLVAEDEIINTIEEEAVSIDEYTDVNDDEFMFHTFLEEDDEEKVMDDIFFEHLSKKKKIGLFLIAVFMTAIVAVIVFAMFFPELI